MSKVTQFLNCDKLVLGSNSNNPIITIEPIKGKSINLLGSNVGQSDGTFDNLTSNVSASFNSQTVSSTQVNPSQSRIDILSGGTGYGKSVSVYEGARNVIGILDGMPSGNGHTGNTSVYTVGSGTAPVLDSYLQPSFSTCGARPYTTIASHENRQWTFANDNLSGQYSTVLFEYNVSSWNNSSSSVLLGVGGGNPGALSAASFDMAAATDNTFQPCYVNVFNKQGANYDDAYTYIWVNNNVITGLTCNNISGTQIMCASEGITNTYGMIKSVVNGAEISTIMGTSTEPVGTNISSSGSVNGGGEAYLASVHIYDGTQSMIMIYKMSNAGTLIRYQSLLITGLFTRINMSQDSLRIAVSNNNQILFASRTSVSGYYFNESNVGFFITPTIQSLDFGNNWIVVGHSNATAKVIGLVFTTQMSTTNNTTYERVNYDGIELVSDKIIKIQGPVQFQNSSITASDGKLNISSDLAVLGKITNYDTTDSTSVNTGSVIVSGGIGIAKTLNVGSSTNSTSSTTGSIISAGGLGIAKNAYIGGQIFSVPNYYSVPGTVGPTLSSGTATTLTGTNMWNTGQAVTSGTIITADPSFSSNGRIVVSYTGMYLVACSLSFASNIAGYRYLDLFNQSGLIQRFSFHPIQSAGQLTTCTFCFPVPLSTGNYVYVQAYHNAGGSVAVVNSLGSNFKVVMM
jgi:hypothetical protein